MEKGNIYKSKLWFEEIDPTVPDWAKEDMKPVYTKEEIGLGNVDNTSDAEKNVKAADEDSEGNIISNTYIKKSEYYQQNYFSLEENICGKWIDGSPIYRKVITGVTGAVNGSYDFADVSDLNIKQIINLHGNMKNKSGGSEITVPITIINSDMSIGTAINLWYSVTGKKIIYSIVSGSGYLDSVLNLVLEYTKED